MCTDDRPRDNESAAERFVRPGRRDKKRGRAIVVGHNNNYLKISSEIIIYDASFFLHWYFGITAAFIVVRQCKMDELFT